MFTGPTVLTWVLTTSQVPEIEGRRRLTDSQEWDVALGRPTAERRGARAPKSLPVT